MEINFDVEAQERLLLLSATDFVLDYDDSFIMAGENVRADAYAVDTIMTRLRLIAVRSDEIPADFDGLVVPDTFRVHYREWGEMFLGKRLSIRKSSSGLIEAMNESGLISSNVQIVDAR